MRNPAAWSTSTFSAYLRRGPVATSTPDYDKIHALGRTPTDDELAAAFRIEVIGWARETAAPDSLGAYEARGVRVRDRLAGLTYEVTVDEGLISSITILPDEGVDIATRRPPLPLNALRRLAVEATYATVPTFGINVQAHRAETPTPEQVATIVGEVKRDGGSARQVLAREFHVTPFAADKWIKQARDLGMIPPSTTGRPRRRGRS